MLLADSRDEKVEDKGKRKEKGRLGEDDAERWRRQQVEETLTLEQTAAKGITIFRVTSMMRHPFHQQ